MSVKVLRKLCTKLHNFFLNLVELWNKHGVRKNRAHVPVVSVLKNKCQGLQTVRSTLIWFKCVTNSCPQGEKLLFKVFYDFYSLNKDLAVYGKVLEFIASDCI